MSDKIAYHVTPRQNLSSILKDGLTPHKRDNFPTKATDESAIWVFGELYHAEWWAKFHKDVYGNDPVFLEINIDGIKLGEDTMLPDWFDPHTLLTDKVATNRITLIV